MTMLVVVLALLLAGCATTPGAADNSGSESISASVIENGTAYSRKMDGTVFNWRNTDCSCKLDADGNVILSYDNGKTTVKAPLLLSENADDDGPHVENTGFFISGEKTAIAYSSMDSCGPITVLTSSDKGRTWETVSISFEGCYLSWMTIGFTTKEQGWLVTCSEPALGAEKHSIYVTSDGGKTWTPVNSNIDEVYGRVLSGAGYVNDKVGFLCFRYESDFQPAICMTRDGGLTWSKLSVNLPKEYDGYNKTPLSPALEGTEIVLPVLLTDDSGEAGTIYLISEDEGMTWQCKTAMSDEHNSSTSS